MARRRRKEAKPKKRRRPLIVDERLKDAIPTTWCVSIDSLGDIEGNEERFKQSFPEELAHVGKLFSDLYTLHAVLMERRARLDDSSDLRSALDLLGAKGFADVRGAHILLERGYAMASLGPIRAAAEASDLMVYFLMHPEEVASWWHEDAKFKSLGWIRKQLPVDPTPSYNFLNIGLHANWRLIPHLMRKEAVPTSTHYEVVVGPSRHAEYTESLTGLAAFHLMKLTAALYEHRPDLVSDIWRGQFEACSRRSEELMQKLLGAAHRQLDIKTALAEQRLRTGQAQREPPHP